MNFVFLYFKHPDCARKPAQEIRESILILIFVLLVVLLFISLLVLKCMDVFTYKDGNR